ncbi:lytic transglycosylase domain-containing protein [Nocardioides faecalis]|uniref:lytic transglycosylase domain-containing protein n=1 Tax=Nocardioides faecalis TaxID=2803858 RepID=UPI0027DADE27|nr:lytic transglycosylase domain-containing protein [Nocardioides faecalis]
MGTERLRGASIALGALALVAVGTGIAMAASSDPARPASLNGGVVVVQAEPSAVPAPAAGAGSGATNPYQPAPEWLDATARSTGIPARALSAYAGAQLRLAEEQPGCRVGWNTLAGIGWVESGHGAADETVLGADGRSVPAVRGPALDGTTFAAIRDTDGGALDGDTAWDRAVGPLQFIPSTWERWGADGDGDGTADPDQIDDAALAAARYLCHSGNLSVADTWRRAVFSYNHSDDYVAAVATHANTYASRAR